MGGDRVARRARLGRLIKDTRDQLSMSQAELAEAIGTGVRQTAVSRWENGEVLFDLDMIFDIETALHLAPGTLLIRAGFVEPDNAGTTEMVIVSDPVLSPEARKLLLHTYTTLRTFSAAADAVKMDGKPAAEDPQQTKEA